MTTSRLVGLLHEIGKSWAQVICATHSPVLAATPDADIFEFGDHGIRHMKWEELELVDHWRRFMARPGAYLRHFVDDEDGGPMIRELADVNHRKWLLAALEAAARKLGLTLSGQPVFGWNDRSVGAQADGNPQSEPRWLRVVTEHASWAQGDWWTGNTDSSAITGVHKPQVLDLWEWEEGTERLRAEVMTLVPGEPLSPTPELTTDVGTPLPPAAWPSPLLGEARSGIRGCLDTKAFTYG